MALPLSPGAQVGDTRGWLLHNAADSSGNLFLGLVSSLEEVLLAGVAGSECQPCPILELVEAVTAGGAGTVGRCRDTV